MKWNTVLSDGNTALEPIHSSSTSQQRRAKYFCNIKLITVCKAYRSVINGLCLK